MSSYNFYSQHVMLSKKKTFRVHSTIIWNLNAHIVTLCLSRLPDTMYNKLIRKLIQFHLHTQVINSIWTTTTNNITSRTHCKLRINSARRQLNIYIINHCRLTSDWVNSQSVIAMINYTFQRRYDNTKINSAVKNDIHTFSQANKTGAVASPSFKSAAVGFPIVSVDDTKSSISSTNWKAKPMLRPYWKANSLRFSSAFAMTAVCKVKRQ